MGCSMWWAALCQSVTVQVAGGECEVFRQVGPAWNRVARRAPAAGLSGDDLVRTRGRKLCPALSRDCFDQADRRERGGAVKIVTRLRHVASGGGLSADCRLSRIVLLGITCKVGREADDFFHGNSIGTGDVVRRPGGVAQLVRAAES